MGRHGAYETQRRVQLPTQIPPRHGVEAPRQIGLVMEPQPPSLPLGVVALFVGIVFGLAATLIVAAWRAGRNLGETQEASWRWTIGIAGFMFIWLTATVMLAARGGLSDWSKFPPPIIRLLAAAIILNSFCAFSRLGG